MMTSSPGTESPGPRTPKLTDGRAVASTVLSLSRLLQRPIVDRGGESLGKVSDVIVGLRGADYPLVTGLVGAVGGGRDVFVPIEQVADLAASPLGLISAGSTCGISSV